MPDFELFFSVSGGYPVVEASLALRASGQAEMFLGNSWSLPGGELDRAGWFGGRLPAEIAGQIEQALQAPALAERLAQLQRAQGEPLPFDTLVKSLQVELAGQTFKLDLPAESSDPWAAALEDLIRQAMAALSRQPRQALQLQARLKHQAAALLPTFHLGALGEMPANLLLYEAAVPPRLCSASVRLETQIEFPDGSFAWNPKLNQQVPPAHWTGQIEQGNLPSQVHLEPQGDGLFLTLPELPPPAEASGLYFSGMFSAWAAAAGGGWVQLSIQSTRQPLTQLI